MVLQQNRTGFADIAAQSAGRQAFELKVILHHHSVMQDGNRARFDHVASIALRCMEDHVVALPGFRRAAGIDQRRRLRVDGAGRTLGVGRVSIGVEHLYLVAPLHVDATITARLAFGFGLVRRGELDVNLCARELALRVNVAGAGFANDVTALDGPGSGLAVGVDPLGEVAAALDLESRAHVLTHVLRVRFPHPPLAAGAPLKLPGRPRLFCNDDSGALVVNT